MMFGSRPRQHVIFSSRVKGGQKVGGGDWEGFGLEREGLRGPGLAARTSQYSTRHRLGDSVLAVLQVADNADGPGPPSTGSRIVISLSFHLSLTGEAACHFGWCHEPADYELDSCGRAAGLQAAKAKSGKTRRIPERDFHF